MALSLKASVVVALDPATLDDDVLSLPNVRHLRVRSGFEGALDAAREALRLDDDDDDDSALATLLTCDANEPPAAAAACILPLVPLLAPRALVILTLKLRYPGKDKDFAVRAAMELLEPAGLELLESRWLFANTMCERTLVLRKKK